jgi:hypothetical protein
VIKLQETENQIVVDHEVHVRREQKKRWFRSGSNWRTDVKDGSVLSCGGWVNVLPADSMSPPF